MCQNNCGTRKNLGIKCSSDEMDNLRLLQTKMKCSEQAFIMLKDIQDHSQEDVCKFVSAVLEYKSNFMFLLDSWWDEIIKKYELRNDLSQDIPIFIDFVTNEFYIMEK